MCNMLSLQHLNYLIRSFVKSDLSVPTNANDESQLAFHGMRSDYTVCDGVEFTISNLQKL